MSTFDTNWKKSLVILALGAGLLGAVRLAADHPSPETNVLTPANVSAPAHEETPLSNEINEFMQQG